MQCPFDKSEHSKNSLVQLFSSENPVPSCNECRMNFNLKIKIPKEMSCGYIICLECLGKNYIAKNVINCKECGDSHQNLGKNYTNQYFLDLLFKNAVYCSVHKNRLANFFVPSTLETLCEQCESPDEKISLNDESYDVSDILCEIFARKSQDPEFLENCKFSIENFSQLTNQQKLDKIKEGLKPEKKLDLRSNIPPGRKIIEQHYNENFSFLYRFFSLMPPLEMDPNQIFASKPWVIDYEKKQVEAVVFKCNQFIKLFGFGIGQALNFHETTLELLEIREGKSLALNPLVSISGSNANPKIEPFDHNSEIQTILLPNPFEVKRDQFYNLVIKIKGELLNRGNPFDLKQVQAGSDGVIFEFFEPENVGEFYVNGQHDINGPIIKLLYQVV